MGGKNSKKNTELKEKEIKLLIGKSGLSRQEILDWHQQFLKDFPDGSIDMNEFVQLYKKFYPYGNPEKFAKFAFKAFDIDNSGKITFGEFLVSTAFLLNSTSSDDVEKSYELAFDIYDYDNNGKIDKKEALALLTAVYELESTYSSIDAKTTVDEMFKYYDSDNSGYLNKKEFITALATDQYFRTLFLPD